MQSTDRCDSLIKYKPAQLRHGRHDSSHSAGNRESIGVFYSPEQFLCSYWVRYPDKSSLGITNSHQLVAEPSQSISEKTRGKRVEQFQSSWLGSATAARMIIWVLNPTSQLLWKDQQKITSTGSSFRATDRVLQLQASLIVQLKEYQ